MSLSKLFGVDPSTLFGVSEFVSDRKMWGPAQD
jgi:hypothetical protein